MTDRTHVTLRVELDPQDGSIPGCLPDDDGVSKGFAGWIGLAAAIDDALPDERAVPRSHTEGLGLEEQ